MSDNKLSSGSAVNDLGAEAMSEQTSEGMTQAMSATHISDELNLILDIPVKMTVELGRTKMTIKELLRLSQGSVVALDGLAGEPLDILINGYLIAQGEVVVVSDKFGIRITDIITPSERMHRLSR
ncbi:flagellar motor switch protein FliN [Erwinia amylovora]|uniref:Flagellar motor switch protein FliN n=4 Tax=Erwinia amylovora TaxID=552 RepID=D4HZ08_ERWAC|nr:flagellar motor switch protein FliN [Erwinia amylovora]CDK16076.1 Flagellar motor switch protein FliN [Erwinia amylovora LA635]CDK19443.1 Flagellar motor switch protein FliN [Erwinia amylovora LA636]CDK22814.1 Flagellar motor switch protein FliN [Erwinia amylovora LA637]ATZ12343.1 flagellar motor switch protein FliN [Erwinia amylovora]MBZ2390291.1 flagellar motor switch protein FliN [Erwinia amylovora]